MNYSERVQRRINRSGPLHMYAKSFDILVDAKPEQGGPVIGLQIDPVAGASFIVPIAFGSAREMATMILDAIEAAGWK